MPTTSLYCQAQSLIESGKFDDADVIVKKLLTIDPNVYDALMLKAKIFKFRGKYLLQMKVLEKANEIKKSSGYCLLQLAQVSIKLTNLNQAKKFALSALEKLTSSNDLTELAKIFHGIGLFNYMKISLEKALHLGNTNDELYFLYGDALMLCGKIKQAENAFEKSLSLNSDHALALSNLSKVKKVTKDNNRIVLLKAAIDKQRNPWESINIVDGLARELNDLGKYQQAFESLTKAKRKLLSIYPFDPNDSPKNVSLLSDIYRKNVTQKMTTGLASEQRPIFVVGMPRTGTTVVERILTNCESVMSIGESIQFSEALKEHSGIKSSTLVDGLKLNELWSEINFKKVGISYLEKVNYISELSPVFVDKLPMNILLSGAIVEALPEAKVVCLMRNPLDTIIGNYRQLFEYNSGTYSYSLNLLSLARFVFEFRRLAFEMESRCPNNFMTVDYESLVKFPIEEGQKIFNHCNLEWSEKNLDIQNNNSPVGTASAAQVKEPIHSKAIGQFRNYSFCFKYIKAIADEYDYPLEQLT